MKILLLLIMAYALFIQGIGATSLWDPDEPRQAIMAREMMERGDYIHPYLNGKPYLEKPPLYQWMIIAASRIRGRLDEFSSRIPAALSATCLAAIVYFFGRLLVDPVSGLLSALVLAMNFQFLHSARESVMDMTFALFIGLTVFLNYVAVRKNSKWLLFLSFVPSSLAILAKGPASIVIAAGTALIYIFTEKKFKQLMIPLIAGCLASAVIASIWFLLAGEAYWKEFIFRQNITRYTHAFDHAESFLYYFPKLLFNFLPWSILLPFALYHAWKKKLFLPLIWFGVTFLFFETSMSKRAVYLLPLYPATAIICGAYLREKWEWLIKSQPTNLLCRCFAIASILGIVAVVVAVYLSSSPSLTPFRESPWLVWLILLAVPCIAFLVAITRRSAPWSLLFLFIFLAGIGHTYNVLYVPVMDRVSKSPRIITDALEGYAKDKKVYMVGFDSPGVIFYLGRPVESIYSLSKLTDTEEGSVLIVNDKFSALKKAEFDNHFLPIGHAVYERIPHTIYLRKKGP
jgi:4-amino-4-deoxy-L-arabinose transferase-like glycosyltransferase